MEPRNHFTPFLVVDNPGPDGSEHLRFEGEARRRAAYRPSRYLLGALIVIGALALATAVALAGQRAFELESRYRAEALV